MASIGRHVVLERSKSLEGCVKQTVEDDVAELIYPFEACVKRTPKAKAASGGKLVTWFISRLTKLKASSRM